MASRQPDATLKFLLHWQNNRSCLFRNTDSVMGARRDTKPIEVTKAMVNNSLAIKNLQSTMGASFEALARSIALVFVDINLHKRSY